MRFLCALAPYVLGAPKRAMCATTIDTYTTYVKHPADQHLQEVHSEDVRKIKVPRLRSPEGSVSDPVIDQCLSLTCKIIIVSL